MSTSNTTMGAATSSTRSTKPEAIEPSSLDQRIATLDRHGYLFGLKLTNSWSPFFHDVIYDHFNLGWSQIRLDSADMSLFLELIKHPKFYGASITMPNKVAILPYLDEMTEECRDVGACNTLFIRHRPDGSRIYCGTNTDVIGIRDSFAYNVADPASSYHGKPALVIGGGGAARSAIYALRKWMQVTDIYLVNRDPEEVAAMIADCTARGFGAGLVHVSSATQAEGVAAPGSIVACVPDFEPSTEGEVLARTITETLLRRGSGAMLEMCYNPTPFTRLGALAEKDGWHVILGTEALIYQGLEQDKYWTGKTIEDMPVEKVKTAIAGKVAEKIAQATSKL